MILLRFIQQPELILYIPLSLVLGITVHEFMHAWVANYLGDPTPKREGRISLNPMAHLDPLGTLALVFIGFGWGKPVSINPNNFRNPRLGSALTGIAGPLTNFLLADAMLLIYRFGNLASTGVLGNMVLAIAFYSLILAIFNLIPIPPLDGSGILSLFFPSLDSPKSRQLGPIVLIMLLFFTGFSFIVPIIFDIFRWLGVNPTSLYFLFTA